MSALKEAYLVRENFKAGGKLYLAGTVLTKEEAEQIPLFRIRLNEKKFVSLDIADSAIADLCEYIKMRSGVDAKAKLRGYLTTLKAGEKADAKANPTPGTKPKPSTAKK